MTVNTDSTTGAAQSGTGNPPAQTGTTTGGDSAGKGLLERIDGLTAENKRKDEQLSKLREQLEADRKKHQSEDEKRLETLADAKYGPSIQRLENLERHLVDRRDEMLKTVPADYASYIDSTAPVEKQIQQIETITRILAEKKLLPATGAATTPASDAEPTILDYRRVVALAGSHDKAEREEYEKRWPPIRAAIMSGKLRVK